MIILVTGGTGFIGSHTAASLAGEGHTVIIIDNLSNSKLSVIDRLNTICGKSISFIKGDVRDSALLERVFTDYKIDAVIHFAGLKSVSESVQKPFSYYHNNVLGTLALLSAMQMHGVRKFIFSSSATVYGIKAKVPYVEESFKEAVNPYGRTKLMVEEVVFDLCQADPGWHIVNLRYFNPAGAHDSGLIGEDPDGVPNNLIPYISQVAIGHLKKLNVFGGDYSTEDGTAVRDYIHVMDLAEGHVSALNYLKSHKGLTSINLGRGEGISVLQMIKAFEVACGKKIPFEITERRPGDIDQYWADVTLAKKILNWQAKRDVDTICKDSWRWQQLSKMNGI
jgi:UDP-glucose 4-epimerase